MSGPFTLLRKGLGLRAKSGPEDADRIHDDPSQSPGLKVARPELRVVEPDLPPSFSKHPWRLSSQFCKSIIDKILALFALVFLSPFFLLVAILIKLTSPGPVIYRQVRVGIDRRFSGGPPGSETDRRRLRMPGRPFVIYKFRTMVDGAENSLGPVWAAKGDPRVTAVGRVLRTLRVDEMPQFLNVLKGDMSLVGPRPERPVFVNELVDSIPGYAHRLRVKPGITGLAQVEHQYDASLDDVRRKVNYDLHYIHRRNLIFDLRILVKTIWVVLTGRGSR